MRPTPESIAWDYRRMAQSARDHGRPEWADHWDAKAELVMRTRKIKLTPAERQHARLEQRSALRRVGWSIPTKSSTLRQARRGRVAC